ncbi:MAG: PAS/PAC sensor hybrid histidine kinase [Limisphaerales bacterium]|nr:MAG: PAS/PAC sensor hybrid histidine kinase [Limisphaerales bacterium]KAG0510616.1 MAG: PAS/PAC sensor hybrid histidine kinase [Limisphaerales bacterium]TXT52888.1 MAG: PAS/PAC sensor hybrid histidine kinase [Limisphaerales bacterium]
MKGSGFTQMFFRRPQAKADAQAADFPLESAAWPVLVVSALGEVTQANAFARAVFGGADGNPPKRLVGLWTFENGCSAEQFLRQLDSGATFTFPLKLQTTKEGLVGFLVHISPWLRGGKKEFIFQVHPKPATRPASVNQPPAEVPAPAPAAPETNTTPEPKPAPDATALTLQQKLLCALQLTRTVAMDFNNALTSIMGHATHVLGQMPPDHPWRGSVQQIEKAAERATQVSFDLSAFSREEKEAQPDTSGNLGRLVRKLVDQYKGRSPGAVIWRVNLETRLFSAPFSEAKLSQAVEKILDNAIEAVGAEGTLSVSTQNRDLNRPTEDGRVTLPPGTYVCIEINDTGPGIPADVLPQVVDPFFTTKRGHRGLGLAWAYGIITNHGGCLALTSPPGQGTTVRIYLPAHGKTLEEGALADEDLRGDQTVLIVDDEELLLTMSEMVLTSFGYRVLTASNGRQALDIIERSDSHVDLVVTDLVMPHMDGHQLIQHLQNVAPGLRIICTSGNFRPSNRQLGVTYLQKPFTSQDLLRVVKEAFQQPAPGEPRPAAEVRSANAAAEEQADANSAAQVGHS